MAAGSLQLFSTTKAQILLIFFLHRIRPKKSSERLGRYLLFKPLKTVGVCAKNILMSPNSSAI